MSRGFTALYILCITVLGMTFAVGPASAAQQSLPSLSTLQSQTLAKPIQYDSRDYCVRQYFTCRDRWGGGSRFKRCLKWRGCWEAYVEFRERREERWRRRRDRYDRGNDYDDDGDDDYDNGSEDRSEGYSCSHWQKACSENWGHDNSDYYGCLKFHGCE